MSNSHKLFSKNTFILFLIILLGAILRIYHLGKEDLWLDEIFTILDSRQSVFKVLPDVLKWGTFPFFTTLVHLSIRLFGESAVTVRLPSCICGILSIPMMYWVGKKLFNPSTGLIASFFLAISPYHIYYSQEARTYSLQILLLLATIYFFIKLLDDDKPLYWHLFLGCELLATFAHWYSAILVLTLNIFMGWLWFSRKDFRTRTSNWILSQGIYWMVIFPWYLILSSYQIWKTTQWIPPLSFKVIPETFYDFSTGITEMDFPTWILFAGSLTFGILMLSALWNRFTKKTDSPQPPLYDSFGLSWTLFLLPIIIFYLYSMKMNSYLAWRYLIIALPGFYLVSAKGIMSYSSRTVKILLLLCVTLIYALCLHQQFSKPHKISLRKPAEYVHSHQSHDDAIMIVPSFWDRSFSYYYPNAQNILLPDSPIAFENMSKETAGKFTRVWLVEIPPYISPSPLSSYYQTNQTILLLPERGVRLSLYSNPVSK